MRVLVVGVARPLGAKIALALARDGVDVVGTRRVPGAHDEMLGAAGIRLAALDLRDQARLSELAAEIQRVVLTPILSLSAPAAVHLARMGVKRGLVFSSHNVTRFTGDPIYEGLRAGETQLSTQAPGWTVLRPTMIYGGGDQNLSRLLSWLKTYPLVPFPGAGTALQQPIHVDDLARVAAGLAVESTTQDGPVSVGGPDTVSYLALISLAKQVLDSRAVTLGLPTGLIGAVARAGRSFGLSLPSASQLARADVDKHVEGPGQVPDALAPQIGLEEGLRRLALDLGLIPPDR